ncbi:MAG TPA: DUF2637 domain-containing protein [Streptosporangiaceae bacterium]|nr:DUF2637 domain-containing protein [Streptosporangiaceae bacterium]
MTRRWPRLARIAGAISYSHMRQLAQDHGQAGWHAHAFPLSVDLAANVATAGPGMVSRVIAGWPALALLIAVSSCPACSTSTPRHGPPPSRPARNRTKPPAICGPRDPSRSRPNPRHRLSGHCSRPG